jgi:transcriptional regulator with XRE-family HTH domain
MDPEVVKLLKGVEGEIKGKSIVALSQKKIIDMKVAESKLSGEELAMAQQRRSELEYQETSLIAQAKATQQARDAMFGENSLKERRLKFAEQTSTLEGDDLKLAQDLFNQNELLLKQEERLKQLKEGQNQIMGALPGGLQKSIGFIKNMITGIKAFGIEAGIATAGITLAIGAIVAGLAAFTALESAGEDFRKETGITNSQMGDMASKANELSKSYAQYGVEVKDVYDTMASLKAEFSDIANYSEAAVGALTVMKSNFGVSAENAAKVQGVLENVGGLSEDTAASVQLQVANMSKLAGVAPKKVMEDIAKSAETTSTFFKGDVQLLAKQAVQARRLGTDLQSVAKVAEKLLDFEGGIEEELKAATFVGGQFNLSRARALAFEGKIVEAQQETLDQIQRSGDFRKKDYFTQQQLAKAANMTVEEVNKQLNVRDKLSKLSGDDLKKAEAAINAGLDISKINDEQLMQEVEKQAKQQETASMISQLENTFKGILATVGGALVPLFQGLGPILKLSFLPLKWAAQILSFIVDAITSVIKMIPGLGSLMEFLGGADANIPSFAEASGGGGMKSNVAETPTMGDVVSPASGKTMVSTKEGGVYNLSKNDDLVAAPGAAAAVGAAASQSGGSKMDLSALSAPLNNMIAEIKALRADMASGKIAVYMDSQKVTSGVSAATEKSTRNNYSLA